MDEENILKCVGNDDIMIIIYYMGVFSMDSNKPKSINSLMAHMRDSKNIQIGGSFQKRKLRVMGYFHGYKGYRYYNDPKNLLPFANFNELQAVYDFDMKLKAVFYPQIMFLETAIKNYTLEIILSEASSKRFAEIYSKLMTDYKSYKKDSKSFRNAMAKRMNVRNKVYGNISKYYSKSNIIKHYYDSDRPVPMWAVFEILSLGEFANFISCINQPTRKKISNSVGIDANVDSSGRMVEDIVFTLKDLRNSIAHNNTVFDTRFKTGSVKKNIMNYISQKTNIANIDFKTIVDYLILICFVQKLLKCNKSDILAFIKQFEDICESFRKQVPMNIYSKIIYTDSRKKIKSLKTFL